MLSSNRHSAQELGSNAMKADFYTSDDSLLILIDMPGVSKESVNVTFREGRLLIEGTDTRDHSGTHRRSFQISDRYETGRTRASVEHGVIRLEIPKHADAKTVRIPVNAG